MMSWIFPCLHISVSHLYGDYMLQMQLTSNSFINMELLEKL